MQGLEACLPLSCCQIPEGQELPGSEGLGSECMGYWVHMCLVWGRGRRSGAPLWAQGIVCRAREEEVDEQREWGYSSRKLSAWIWGTYPGWGPGHCLPRAGWPRGQC